MKIFLLLFLLFSLVNANTYRFGIYPSNSPQKVKKAFSPLIKYLTKNSKNNFELVITKDYKELSDRLRNGSLDFAWLGSKNYLNTKKEIVSINYLTTYMEQDKNTNEIIPYYSSFIIALKESNINTLNDLKTKSFAFTDKLSTSGYAYPNKILINNNINYKNYFSKVYFLKKHDRVIEALVNKSIDAGAVSDGTYYNAIKKYGDIFKIIIKSDKIPLDVIVSTNKVDDKLKDTISILLSKLDINSFELKSIKEHLGWNAAGFDSTNEYLYEILEKTLNE